MSSPTKLPNSPRKYGISLALILTGMVLFGVLTLWNVSRAKVESRDEKRAQERRALLTETLTASQELVHGAAWVDKEKGIARIPVADATGLAVKALAVKPVVSSTVRVAVALAAPSDGVSPAGPATDANAAVPATPAASGTAGTGGVDTAVRPQAPSTSATSTSSETAAQPQNVSSQKTEQDASAQEKSN